LTSAGHPGAVVLELVLLGAVDALEASVLLLLAVLVDEVATLDELVASVAPVDCVELVLTGHSVTQNVWL
jgi:hypothetical protein